MGRTGLWWSSLVLIAAAACGDSNGAGPHGGSGEAGAGGAGGEESLGGGGSADAGSPAAGEAGEAGTGTSIDLGGAGGADPSLTAGQSGAGGAEPEATAGEHTFAPNNIIEVRLTLPAKTWQSLEEHGNLERYVRAAATLTNGGGFETELAEVGLRHKGAWSLHHCWDDFGGVRSYLNECQKLSYKLKFDEYDLDGSFDGLKRLNLHAASGDASKLRELVGYHTFRDAGVMAPRAVPARVYINDEFQGLFIAVEEVDDVFAKTHFAASPDGNLYKEVWPNALLTDEDFEAALETNDEEPDVSDMRAFARAVMRTTFEDFDDDVASRLELDAVLRYVAVDRALRNWDGITAFYSPLTPHNFFWYRGAEKADRFQLIPWDLDNTLWAFDPFMAPEQWVTASPLPNLNMEPRNCEPRPVWDPTNAVRVTPPRCDKFLDLLIENHWSDLVSVGTSLRESALDPQSLRVLADHYRDQIEPIVAEDPTLDSAVWALAADDLTLIFSDAMADFDDFLQGGLLEETEPDINSITSDSGLHVGGLTNFEFAMPPQQPAPSGAFAFGDPLCVFAPTWSTLEPISGTADLRLDFTFTRGPEPRDEYVTLGLYAAPTDASAFTQVVVWLATDVPRQVRISFASPAYDDTFGGIWQEFSAERSVGTTAEPFVIDFASLTYPDWARASWLSGQGFPGTDEEARALVLSRLNGLAFSPAATTDANGELTAETETGYLRVDNIYFQ
jgi:spore coat protein H